MARVWLGALLLLGIGCNDYKVLSGQWFGEDPLPLSYFDSDGQVTSPLYVELNLGHYGNDVVGVARYYTKPDPHPLNLPKCGSVPDECRCHEVMGNYHVDKQRFRLYLDPYCSGTPKLVELTLQDDDLMVWSVPTDETNVSKEVKFARILDEKSLKKSHKICAPCQ